jgi:hypothetical protein
MWLEERILKTKAMSIDFSLFQPYIDDIRSRVDEVTVKAIDSIDCFAVLWHDETGICPEIGCVLRNQCQKTYERAVKGCFENDFKPSLTPIKEKPYVPTVPAPILRKHKKHEKKGYTSEGRQTDILVQTLLYSLGNPPELPVNWSYKKYKEKHNELGILTISPTTSFHSFLVDGTIICRFWTNASNLSLVDLSSSLISKVQESGFSTVPVPPNSYKKIKPCTGRWYCETQDQAILLSNWIKEVYLQKEQE